MTTPKVFISYSHDSEEHKAWVADLARFLISNGIDVVIDAWNLRRGEDIPKFMEDGLSSADRVLMICTERYVEKADGDRYCVELYPHVAEFSSGIRDPQGHELEIPPAFRQSRRDGRPRGIIKLKFGGQP